MSPRSLAVLLAALLVATPLAAQDHPLVSPYPGSKLTDRKAADFEQYTRIIGAEGEASLTEQIEGRVTRLKYHNPEGRSPREIVANYRQALEAAGMRVDYACEGSASCRSTGVGWKQIPSWNALNGLNLGAVKDVHYVTGTLQHEGRTAIVSVGANPNVHHLHVVELQAMQTGLVVVDAAALGKGLDRDGRVVLDGIFFDTDSATLQAASDAALEQAATLLQQRPTLKLYVVGHTDAQGSLAHNLGLSKARAASVVQALTTRFGVAAGRLDPHGVGPLSPRASNAAEPGRANNRRVELVQQ